MSSLTDSILGIVFESCDMDESEVEVLQAQIKLYGHKLVEIKKENPSC